MKRPTRTGLGLAAGMIAALELMGASSPGATHIDVYSNDTPAIKARMEMRRLWTQHASLVHSYIVSAVADLPDAEAIARHTLGNADDIADAMAPYYGDESAKKLSSLLEQHVMLFSDAVRMAKTGEKDEMGPVQDRLQATGDQIVALLAELNPNWKRTELDKMFEEHINHENDELMARIDHDWDGDIRAWDEAQLEALKLADTLSLGLERQFPDRFAAVN